MKIYLLGIAGTGMGSFAGLLRAAGHEVVGSDENVYPPMSEKLAEWRIQTFTPYSAANLDKAKPDLAVVGNVIRADNPEAPHSSRNRRTVSGARDIRECWCRVTGALTRCAGRWLPLATKREARVS